MFVQLKFSPVLKYIQTLVIGMFTKDSLFYVDYISRRIKPDTEPPLPYPPLPTGPYKHHIEPTEHKPTYPQLLKKPKQ